MRSKYIYRSKWVDRFLTGKSIILYCLGWSKWQSKPVKNAPVCTFGKTVSWLICHNRSAIRSKNFLLFKHSFWLCIEAIIVKCLYSRTQTHLPLALAFRQRFFISLRFTVYVPYVWAPLPRPSRGNFTTRIKPITRLDPSLPKRSMKSMSNRSIIYKIRLVPFVFLLGVGGWG